jgi:MoCo/4Fe-4S cofactor protein with predicted Tat translocation signal
MSLENQSNPTPVRTHLTQQKGREYWKSLEEYAESDEFLKYLENEFPEQASEWTDPAGRRKFLKLMGASLALAGVSGCSYQPPESIVPYVQQPEGLVPGKPLFFATAMTMAGVATGLLVRSNMGRPTKIEGNPDHPESLGATDLFAQASLLGLYDPDRSQTILYKGEIRPYSALVEELQRNFNLQRGKQGAGIRILTETITSPSLGNQIQELLRAFPAAKWHQYEPAGSDGTRLGTQQALGRYANTIYRFDQAKRVLSIDSDFLHCGPGSLRYVRDFIKNRRANTDPAEMNRLYVVQSTPTHTGSIADHRLTLRPSEIEPFTIALANALGAGGNQPGGQTSPAWTGPAGWIEAVAKDLRAHSGSSVVIAGGEQSPAVHLLVHRINSALGNVGKTVIHTNSVEVNPVDQMASLKELVADLQSGAVDLLLILGGNPVYTAPADLNFAQNFQKARLRVRLGLYNDETSELSHWHIPEAHYLESWGDARAYDGTVSIIQPLIEPLYQGKTAYEVLATASDRPDRSSYEIVREYWQTQNAGGDFEQFWRRTLHNGIMENTAFNTGGSPAGQTQNRAGQNQNQTNGQASAQPAAPPAAANNAATPLPITPARPAGNDEWEIVFRTDPTVYDGRFANNGWLQELPKPLTKVTWDNVALLSPKTAERMGVGRKIGWKGGEVFADVIRIEYKGRTVQAPAMVMPGQPDNVVTVFLGYGRKRAGRVGTKTGYNAYNIRTSDAPWHGTGVKVTKTGLDYQLSATQLHHEMQGRDLVRSTTITEYINNPHSLKGEHEIPADFTLYPQYDYKGYAWGMAIDVNNCVGCSACVVACQSENNIPIVGKEQVARSREMHWLRVDAYHKGTPENPEGTFFQPVPCMHCESAPCEPVCPVAATTHSAEGLNDMVYNRCIGTRYCSNNCPYKVRRFNFLLYQDWNTPTYKLMRNPEVSVRSRGVMEKCTYCVQRIEYAKIEAEKEGRVVRDGEIKTACQSVCPAEAIVFGNINDPNSRVRKMKEEARNYSMLGELNTKPRTTYLAALRNPNPEITV